MSKKDQVYGVSVKVGSEMLKHNRRLFRRFGVNEGDKFKVRFRKTRFGRIDVLGINEHRVSRAVVFPLKFRKILEDSIGKHAKPLDDGTERWDRMSRDERKENMGKDLDGFGDFELGGVKIGIPILILGGIVLLSSMKK